MRINASTKIPVGKAKKIDTKPQNRALLSFSPRGIFPKKARGGRGGLWGGWKERRSHTNPAREDDHPGEGEEVAGIVPEIIGNDS
jgi:hypothetical protein